MYHELNLVPRILFFFFFFREKKPKWSSFHSLKHPRLKSTPSGQGKWVTAKAKDSHAPHCTSHFLLILSKSPLAEVHVVSSSAPFNKMGKELLVLDLYLKKSFVIVPKPF